MNKAILDYRTVWKAYLEFRPICAAFPARNDTETLLTQAPRPIAAVDAHAHVFERGLPLARQRRYAPGYDATLDEYLMLLDRHGLRHGVLVQPSFLGTDNGYMVRALKASAGRLRGVAVVDPQFDAQTLRALADAGVVGMRLNLMGVPTPELASSAWRALLEQANGLRWHVEVHAAADRLPDIMPSLLELGCRVVVDHFGRPTCADDLRHVLAYAGTRQVWIKLSAAYRNWTDAECAAASRHAARQLLDAYGAGRLMWGSDWPHTEHRERTDYTSSLAWLDDWLEDAADRRGVLADTPLDLFQFEVEGEDA